MANRFIEKLGGFVDLTKPEIAALERATARPQSFGKRKDLIREGDRPGPVFIMLAGWAVRYKVLPNGTRQIMAFLMPGDTCDLHVSMLAEMDHSIQTISQAEVATISGDLMDELLARHVGIAQAMYISQLIDESTLRAWIVSLGRRSSIERAAHLLLELYVRAVCVGLIDSGAMELPISQSVLADALGMTSVHVNRVLQSLRKSDAIELQRGMLRIADPSILVRLSGFDDNYLHRRLRPPSLDTNQPKD